MQSVSATADQVLGMENPALKRLVKLGARIQTLLKAA